MKMVELIKKLKGTAYAAGMRTWFFSTLGNTEGSITIDKKQHVLKRGGSAVSLRTYAKCLTFQSTAGTLGDSLDDFIFYYTDILPNEENFELSATFTVERTGASISWQSGYGIFAIDTANCSSRNCRYRNILGLGRFRMRSAAEHSSGMRVVSGYQDAEASEICGKRVLDLSRDASFPEQKSTICSGETYRFLLKKTDDGFMGRIQFNGYERTFLIPGCDFLMRQEEQKIYVGLALAGDMTLKISDLHFLRTAGKSSCTPEGAIQMVLPDYPFSRYLIPKTPLPDRLSPYTDLFVSPDGKSDADGSRANPLTLQEALNIVQPGQTIWMKDGVYRPHVPYEVSNNTMVKNPVRTVLRAEHVGQAIIDGSDLEQRVPLFILRGTAWHLKDIIFRNSPMSGLFICGSYNLIEHCEACFNQDTGILICSFPGTGRKEWPNHNYVLCCDSHHNCDHAGENADGFGAKLSVGAGNLFFECTAHHNVDDGFDLFSKNVLGPIEPVRIENCIAYRNGRSVFPLGSGKTGGMGFKLGGDNIAIKHTAKNCIAFENDEAGFGTNYNPYTRLDHVTAYRNGNQPLHCNYRMITSRTDIPSEWELFHVFPADDIYYEYGNKRILPQMASGTIRKSQEPDSNADFAQNYENYFQSTDVSTPITRGEDDLINMHGLFCPKTDHQEDCFGAQLDDRHIEDRLRAKQRYILDYSVTYQKGHEK